MAPCVAFGVHRDAVDRSGRRREVAKSIAQQWLDRNLTGTTTEAPDTFYGYYTVHTRKDGKISGMLSVNGYGGAVWYHTWHGAFIASKEAMG
jgi:hypothetical protein